MLSPNRGVAPRVLVRTNQPRRPSTRTRDEESPAGSCPHRHGLERFARCEIADHSSLRCAFGPMCEWSPPGVQATGWRRGLAVRSTRYLFLSHGAERGNAPDSRVTPLKRSRQDTKKGSAVHFSLTETRHESNLHSRRHLVIVSVLLLLSGIAYWARASKRKR